MKKHRHGTTCVDCDSTEVVIQSTRTRVYPGRSGERTMIRRQFCRCLSCGRRWWRRLQIEERELGPRLK